MTITGNRTLSIKQLFDLKKPALQVLLLIVCTLIDTGPYAEQSPDTITPELRKLLEQAIASTDSYVPPTMKRRAQIWHPNWCWQ